MEQIQADLQKEFEALKQENKILSKFKYEHVTSKVHSLLPMCFEDEVFSQWTKLLHLVNRCAKKVFDNGNLFKEGLPVDTDLLIKFIEKQVTML